MKRILMVLAATAGLASPVLAADFGVSVNIGQPGFYGQLDIGGFPRPALIYSQPVLVHRAPHRPPPIYLRVPPGHTKHWSKHCHKYNACGQPVYFVKNDWYNREYAPRYQAQRSEHRGGGRDQYRDNYRGDDRGDNRHDSRGNDHDRGHGRGRDHDRDRDR
ncbi:MAG: hypothetical protein U0989_19075 [Azonexus sp.]|nr:hypothetical protein [Azonexus sp.]MDZ4316857.1 hypothetical protein [Azonexus sp.]